MNSIKDLLPGSMRERTFQLKARRDAGAVWNDPQFVECKKCGRRATRQIWNKAHPYTARAGQLVHLKTDFYFLLKNTDNIGNLLQELHPTPAVCGLPKEDAFRFILENEGYDRSYYSGFIGWLDTEGHTDLYVNLRCMEIKPGSDPRTV